MKKGFLNPAKKRAVFILLGALSSTLLFGCYHSITLLPSSPPTAIMPPSERGATPAHISRFLMSVDDLPTSPAQHFAERLLASLDNTHLFSHVDASSNKPGGRYFDLKFNDDERWKREGAVAATIKGILAGGTLFLLAPVLPFHCR